MTDQPTGPAPADQPPGGSGDAGSGAPSPWSRDAAGPPTEGRPPEPQPWSPPPTDGRGQPWAEPAPEQGRPWAEPSAPYGPPSPGYGPPSPGYGPENGVGEPPLAPTPGFGVSPYPGGYGGVLPGYGMPAPDHPQATAALITGIVAILTSFVFGIGGLVAIAAIVLGVKARRDIDRDPDAYSGRGKATAGLVLGIVTLVTVLGVVLLGLLVVLSSPV